MTNVSTSPLMTRSTLVLIAAVSAVLAALVAPQTPVAASETQQAQAQVIAQPKAKASCPARHVRIVYQGYGEGQNCVRNARS